MAGRGADEHDEHYDELRRRVLELHRAATELDGLEPQPPAEVEGPRRGQHDTALLTQTVDELLLPLPDEVRPVDPRLLATVAELTGATDELIAFGERLPVLRDLPSRALSAQVVRASALAVLLGAVLLGLGIWRGLLAVWWLPVVLGLLPVAGRAALLPVAPAAGRHRTQRYAAAVTGAAALLVAPVSAVFGWLPGLGCVLLSGVGAAVLFDLLRGRS